MMTLLSDPFLQNPTPATVEVVWFTEGEGTAHWGEVTRATGIQRIAALSRRMERFREDEWSYTLQIYEQVTDRPVWRHHFRVEGLTPGEILPYRVCSEDGDRQCFRGPFTLQSSPAPGQPLTILLTSDHQLMPLVAANIQRAAEQYGGFDGVFYAGDLVNVPDRASEWFDDRRGRSFFPVLQGRASVQLGSTRYQGAPILQHTPLFPCMGNHEVMGRYSDTLPLHHQFKQSQPRSVAMAAYEAQGLSLSPTQKAQWIADHSFNWQTYQAIFSIPSPHPYYAVTFGDIRLISLMITNAWRSPLATEQTPGRYEEAAGALNNPEQWGHGQFIFEPITPGSAQYNWLKTELERPEFRQARYKIVMFHHPPHGLGGNVTPPYGDPQPEDDISNRRYHYPQDVLARWIIPLLEDAGVQLVFYGHSHLWNRFQRPGGLHFLETSNVGNSYGAYWANTDPRPSPPFVDPQQNPPYGDPQGLAPIIPTVAPLKDAQGRPLPYLASNDLTAFSVLETATGAIKSYYFAPKDSTSEVVLFDEFYLVT